MAHFGTSALSVPLIVRNFHSLCPRSCWTPLQAFKLDTVRQVVAVNVLPLQGPSVCGLNLLEFRCPLQFAANCALWDSSQDPHLFCGFCCGDSFHTMATSSSSSKMEQQPPDWALLQLDVDLPKNALCFCLG